MMRKLIGVEIALSFVLLVLAGLFVRSAANLADTDFAFEPEEVYSALISVPEAGYEDAAARTRFAENPLAIGAVERTGQLLSYPLRAKRRCEFVDRS